MNIAGKQKSIGDFWVAGINYRTTDTVTRGSFSIDHQQYNDALQQASSKGLNELFILSTCNRIEIYGFAPSATDLAGLMCPKALEGTNNHFHELAYVKNGMDAVRHLFQVSAGLDSQILGDYEIVGQVKTAVAQARKQGFIGTYLDRLINTALQASKAIRSSTKLSNGTVSVAFAAVQFMKLRYPDLQDRKVLLVGTGKIGRNACKSLVESMPAKNITVINRTAEKAMALATEFGMQYAPAASMEDCIQHTDIILVATNDRLPVISKKHLFVNNCQLIIDLSVPNNVAQDVLEMEGVTLINVDELSRVKDETLQQREAEIPYAETIITAHLAELEDWYGTRSILHTVTDRLHALHSCCYPPGMNEEKRIGGYAKNVHHIIASLAVKVKQDQTVGCHCIAAFNEYISSPAL